MSQIVRCDICGGMYNQRYLSSHKRLSHGKHQAPAHSPHKEPASAEEILSMYEGLPEERKKEVLKRLSVAEQTKQ